MKRALLSISLILMFLLSACGAPTAAPTPVIEHAVATVLECQEFVLETGGTITYCPPTEEPSPEPSHTVDADTETPAAPDTATEPAPTEAVSETPTLERPTETVSPSETATVAPSFTPASPTSTQGSIAPFRAAPLCPDHGELHDPEMFHTLWDAARGCHYNHEHGQNPLHPEVVAVFAPIGSVEQNGCGKQVSHCVPSSPMENTMKHGGHKWQVTHNPNGCTPWTGIQAGAVTGVDWAVIQYHNFGNYFKTDAGLMPELESRIHSVSTEIRQCKPSDTDDFGYMYVEQWQEFGQRLRHYQGPLLPYPDQPSPAYDVRRAPYVAGHCLFGAGCRASLAQAQANASACIWTSDPQNIPSSAVFQQLFRCRDGYQLVDGNDNSWPLTSYWLCTSDGGATYNPVGCRYNNTASSVQEIGGEIPAAWDNHAWDTDSRVGRITAQGYVTRFGLLAPACTTYGPDCQPIKLVQAFVGHWGALLIDNKINQHSPEAQPERDIFFCGNQLCLETSAGAAPSGWIGPAN